MGKRWPSAAAAPILPAAAWREETRVGRRPLPSAATAAPPGSPYTITPSLATGGTFNPANYTITYNTGALTVYPAGLAVAVNNCSRPYGAANPAFSVTYSNFVNGETLGASDVAGSPALGTGADRNSPVGAY